MLSRTLTKAMVTILFLDLVEDFVRNFDIFVFLQFNYFRLCIITSYPTENVRNFILYVPATGKV